MPERVNVSEMLGKKYAKLTVIENLYYKGNKNTEVLCLCDCGIKIKRIASHVLKGIVFSCGCAKIEAVIERNTKHGESKRSGRSKEYLVWTDLNKRCSDKGNPVYGAKGISVCEDWQKDFSVFLKDMGRCPFPNYSIERVDNAIGYSKSNCIWADRSTQSAHRTKQRNNTSGYIGILWDKRYCKWIARTAWEGKRI